MERETKLQFVDSQGNVVTDENLVLQEGDRLIFTGDHTYTDEQLHHLSDQMRKFMEGDYKVAILPAGMKVQVLRVES